MHKSMHTSGGGLAAKNSGGAIVCHPERILIELARRLYISSNIRQAAI